MPTVECGWRHSPGCAEGQQWSPRHSRYWDRQVTYSHLHVFLTNMAEHLFSISAFSSRVLPALPMGGRLGQVSSDWDQRGVHMCLSWGLCFTVCRFESSAEEHTAESPCGQRHPALAHSQILMKGMVCTGWHQACERASCPVWGQDGSQEMAQGGEGQAGDVPRPQEYLRERALEKYGKRGAGRWQGAEPSTAALQGKCRGCQCQTRTAVLAICTHQVQQLMPSWDMEVGRGPWAGVWVSACHSG